LKTEKPKPIKNEDIDRYDSGEETVLYMDDSEQDSPKNYTNNQNHNGNFSKKEEIKSNTNTNNNNNNNFNRNAPTNNSNFNNQNQNSQQNQKTSATSGKNLMNINTNMNLNNNNTNTRVTSGGNNPLDNSNPNKNATNVNFKYDPMSGQVKDVDIKVNMDKETAQQLYQDNKKYLPTQQQVISGAKTTGNFVKESGVIDEVGNAVSANAAKPAKKKGGDPLSNFFGKKGKF
jgi:hypothetical protein